MLRERTRWQEVTLVGVDGIPVVPAPVVCEDKNATWRGAKEYEYANYKSKDERREGEKEKEQR